PHDTEDVDVVHGLPVLEVGVADRVQPVRATGVVDQHVDAAELLELPGEGGDGILIRDVEPDGGAADLPGDLGDPVEAAGGHDDVATLPGQGDGGGGTDSGGAAGDNCDLLLTHEGQCRASPATGVQLTARRVTVSPGHHPPSRS